MEKQLSLFDILSKAKDTDVNLENIYKEVLRYKNIVNRIPTGVQIELLPVCNFNCKFCYVKMTYEEVKSSNHHVMGIEEWKWYIDELTKLETAKVTFSGGECTLHPDFIKIYEYAYQKGFDINLITNGSCITDEIIALFEKYPPSKINVTLYGMNKDTYERNCGAGFAFDRVIKNIHLLNEKGFNISLNYTVGKENFCDLEKAINFAQKNEITLLPTNALYNVGKCNEQIINEEYVDNKIFDKIAFRYFSSQMNMSFDEYEKAYLYSYVEPQSSNMPGLTCNAGRCGFDINWKGYVRPCANFDFIQFDPRKLGFRKCWKKLVEWADQVPILEECEECIFQAKCRRCAALHYGDMGEFGKVSPRFCFKVLHPIEAATAQAEYNRMHSKKQRNQTNE